MILLPVVDVLNGVVVRGVAGDRSQYRPIQSKLIASVDPVPVARALLDVTAGQDLYLADLDAILHRRPNLALYRELAAEGIRCWIDAGLRTAADLRDLTTIPGVRWIAGLESLESLRALGEIHQILGSGGLTFSLDLRGGIPLGGEAWPADPLEILADVVGLGVQSVLVLDLQDVGTGTGGTTWQLCQSLQSHFPACEWIVGGGVRHIDDLIAWRDRHVAGVLIASALHDRRLKRNDLLAQDFS